MFQGGNMFYGCSMLVSASYTPADLYSGYIISALKTSPHDAFQVHGKDTLYVKSQEIKKKSGINPLFFSCTYFYDINQRSSHQSAFIGRRLSHWVVCS